MRYEIGDLIEPERPTAVVAASTTWDAFPELWRRLLDEVWSVVRSAGGITPGRNVMLYHDDVPNVEVGVEVRGGFSTVGRVVPSTLPGGRVVTTTHRGRYEELGAAHRAVIDACDERGLERLGARWEIYGHQFGSSSVPEVEVVYLVR
jgi:effector-binding domain-containing protein